MESYSGDIDYHITFPSPELTSDVSDDFHVQDESTNEPVVVLLGWSGCLDKYLSKYVEIYDRKRCVTIRYTAPDEAIFVKSYLAKELAQKLLDVLFDFELTDSKVLFHVFSNGGCILYQYASSLVQNHPDYSRIKICGVVMDSGPGTASVRGAFGSFAATIATYNFFIRFFYLLAMISYFLVSHFFLKVKSLMNNKYIFDFNWYEKIKYDKAPWPHLFLYSSLDKLVPSRMISDIVDYRRSRGFDVTAMQWDDTEHVSHFRFHREAYMGLCQSFLDKCISKDHALLQSSL